MPININAALLIGCATKVHYLNEQEVEGTKEYLDAKITDRILRLTSRNPHNRLAREYRLLVRREVALINGLNESKMID